MLMIRKEKNKEESHYTVINTSMKSSSCFRVIKIRFPSEPIKEGNSHLNTLKTGLIIATNQNSLIMKRRLRQDSY